MACGQEKDPGPLASSAARLMVLGLAVLAVGVLSALPSPLMHERPPVGLTLAATAGVPAALVGAILLIVPWLMRRSEQARHMPGREGVTMQAPGSRDTRMAASETDLRLLSLLGWFLLGWGLLVDLGVGAATLGDWLPESQCILYDWGGDWSVPTFALPPAWLCIGTGTFVLACVRHGSRRP